MSSSHVRLHEKRDSGFALVFLGLFGAAFAALGIYAGVTETLEALAEGDRGKLWVSALGGVVFVAFGCALVALAIVARRRAGQREGEAALHGDEPWLLRKEWAERRISSRSGQAAAVLAIFGLVWCAISTPLLWKIPEEAARRGNALPWIFALFPAIGVALLVAALRAYARWRKFGSSELVLKTLPGVIGGRLEATLELSCQIDTPSGMELALECVHKRTTGSGKSRSTHEQLLWKSEHTVARGRFSLGLRGSSLPVEFTVPYGCEATRGIGSDDEIVWRVVARADVSGVDFYARFDVPVFVTAESSEAVTGDEEIPQVVVTSLSGGAALPGSKVRVRPWRGGGREFWFGPARNPIAASVTTLVALAIAGLASILPEQGAPRPATLGCELVAALVALGAVVHWVGATRVRVANSAIEVTRGPFGIGRTRRWRADEVSRVAVRRGSQYGNHLYWDIVLEIDRPGRTHADGRPWPRAHAAGSRLPSQSEAQALAGAMAETLGIDTGALPR